MHMPTSGQSSERFNDTLYDLDRVIQKIAAGKRTQPRVLLGGGWNAAWPALNGIPENYYDIQGDDRGAMVGQFFMKWNISGAVDCVAGNVEDPRTYQTTTGRNNIIDPLSAPSPTTTKECRACPWKGDHRPVTCATNRREPEVYTFNKEIEPMLKNWRPSREALARVATSSAEMAATNDAQHPHTRAMRACDPGERETRV